MPVVRRGGALECWQLVPVPRLRTWRVRRDPVRPLGAHLALAAAWSRLAAARRDAATRRDLLLVLAQTCGVPAVRAVPLPLLARGAFDVRPWLDDPAAVSALLRQLSAPGDDPYLLEQHGVRAPVGEVRWAPAFAQALLPWLRGRSLETLRAMEQPFLALAPWPDETLTAMACAVATGGHPAWLRLAAEEPPARRALFLVRLLRTGTFRIAPPRDAGRLFTALRHLVRGDSSARDLSYAFVGLRTGAAPTHLAESLRLGRALGWEPPPLKPVDRVPCRAIGRLMIQISCYPQGYTEVSKRLWKLACVLPGSGQILRGVARWKMRYFERCAIVDFLRVFTPEREDLAARRMRRWKVLQPRWPEVLAVARRTPATHRDKAWELLGRLAGRLRFETEPALLDQILAFIARVCRPPFARDADADWVAVFLFICEPSRGVLLDPDSKAWSVIEKLCAHNNRRWLLGEGLSSMANAPEDFVGAALRQHTRPFLEAMIELGTLRKESRAQVWRTFREHPTVACDPGKLSVRETVVMVEAVAIGTAIRNAVPEPLRAHATGVRALEPHRLAHYRAALPGAWTRVQIEVLRGLIERELWRGFPAASGCVQRHTLELAHTITKNRAPLRRLIRTCHAAPQRSVRATHPLNRNWLAAHRLTGSPWDTGDLVFARDIAALGPVTLAFEDDPQAVLRMGTEVSSCLAVGGCNDFSAVANALDANKRVLFARDATGRFLARQLLAISETRTLVCFPVYPDQAPEPLAEFFRLCNYTLAQALRLPLQSPSGEYRVAPLVCRDWYDDGVWEA